MAQGDFREAETPNKPNLTQPNQVRLGLLGLSFSKIGCAIILLIYQNFENLSRRGNFQ